MHRMTPQLRWVIVICAVIWVSYIFSPLLFWLASAITRDNPVRSDDVLAVIPRGWEVTKARSTLVANRPCMTVFCATHRASVLIVADEKGMPFETWRKATLAEMVRSRVGSPTTRAILGTSGRFTCLEVVSEVLSTDVASDCIEDRGRLHVTFVGNKGELISFYEILKSVRTRGGEK
jgi:hypothetical protein